MIVPQLQRLSNTHNDIYNSAFGGALRYLHRISGIPLEKCNLKDTSVTRLLADKWSRWYDTAHFNIVAETDSFTIYKRLVDLMRRSSPPFTSWYEGMINSAAWLRQADDTISSSEQQADYVWQYLQDDRHYIVVGNLVSLLWVGTDDEKSQALKVLKRETGQDFNTPKEWIVWWRENCPLMPYP